MASGDDAAEQVVTQQGEGRRDDGPHGVGGWLAFMIFGLLVLGPLMAVGRMDQLESAVPDPNRMQAQYITYCWGITKSQISLSWVTGIALWKGRGKGVVVFAIAALWLVPLLGAVAYYVAAYSLAGRAFASPMLPYVAQDAFQGSIPALVWTAYLLRSRRVRNTYTVESALEMTA